MIRDAVTAGDMPPAKSLPERYAMAGLAGSVRSETAATGARNHRLDHQSWHVPGFVAHMALHATLRSFAAEWPRLIRDVAQIIDPAQLRVERHDLNFPVRHVT